MTASTKNLLLAGLIAAATLGPVAPAHAHGKGHGDDDVVAPAVPANLEVPAGHHAYRIARARGTQNQVCLPGASETGLVWSFFGPQATLYDDRDEQIATHFLSANPFEDGKGRPTWQHSKDTSAVWAEPIASATDPDFVEAGAVPWLLLHVVGAEAGPAGGHKLSETTYIQRVATTGGLTPAGACYVPGAKLFVPYTADYVFYKAD